MDRQHATPYLDFLLNAKPRSEIEQGLYFINRFWRRIRNENVTNRLSSTEIFSSDLHLDARSMYRLIDDWFWGGLLFTTGKYLFHIIAHSRYSSLLTGS